MMTDQKVMVLGMDGLDPGLVESFAREGRLPNFAKIIAENTFVRLETTNPAQSSVAWSTFSTGTNPGKHGVFDFIWRDPKTYRLSLSLTEADAPRTIDLAGIKIPVSSPRIKVRRKGIPFWEILKQNGVSATIINLPTTFPSEELDGQMLSGMGTPDVRGTQGTFSFYTTENLENLRDIGGKVYSVRFSEGKGRAKLYGPVVNSSGRIREISIPLGLEILRDVQSLKIKIPGEEIRLQEGQWSTWRRVTFKISWAKKIDGILRFHLNRLEPLELYVSPVNFDPINPAMPISFPEGYASEIAHELGLFHTLGMPHDTWALNENRLDDIAFLEQAKTIQAEKEGILKKELNRFRSGLLMMYFGSSDILSHMYWRTVDPGHPLYNDNEARLYGQVIRKYYERMDEIVGEIVSTIDERTILIILSDHGFNTFRRAVHVNAWLRNEGYLVLTDGRKDGAELFQDVDWARTRAYSAGFGGIYINQKGREAKGIVRVGKETDELKQEMVRKLSALKDPMTLEPCIKKVYAKEEIFRGPYAEIGPDLFLGFEAGYRTSWQTALGACPELLMENNLKKWSGDHLCDPSLVPGVFLINRKVNVSSVSMLDMAPTLLGLFGIEKPAEMDGRDLFLGRELNAEVREKRMAV